MKRLVLILALLLCVPVLAQTVNQSGGSGVATSLPEIQWSPVGSPALRPVGIVKQDKMHLLIIMGRNGSLAEMNRNGRVTVSRELAAVCNTGQIRQSMRAVVYRNSEQAKRVLYICTSRIR